MQGSKRSFFDPFLYKSCYTKNGLLSWKDADAAA